MSAQAFCPLESARAIFDQAPFIQHLGIRLEVCEKGFCKSILQLLPEHLQQHGIAHAGILATIADHTAGACGSTYLQENQRVLTAEFKINLLRPTQEKEIECQSKVLKAGKRLIFAESEIYGLPSRQLLAKASVTLAVIEA